MSVPRYTTPTFTLTFTEQGLDLTQATGVYVTFKQALFETTKTGDDLEVEAKKISVTVSTTVTGKSDYGHYNPGKGFHPGMTHAYLVILSDWYNAKNKVEFKDATLTIE